MPETQQTAGELFRAGNLDGAIAAANAEVRRKPGDLGGRVLLAELLIFAGNLERADTILDAASQADPSGAIVVAEFRQLLRADLARRQFARMGRVPSFSASRPRRCALPWRRRWRCAAAMPEKPPARAAEAEALRPRVPGSLKREGGEVAFDDFRDIDDLCAGFFEVLTTNGKYFWVPTERVASIQFHPPLAAARSGLAAGDDLGQSGTGRRGVYPGDLQFGGPRSAGQLPARSRHRLDR